MRYGLLLGLCILLPSAWGASFATQSSPPKAIAADYGALRMRFEPNVGQAPAAVRYLARGKGYGIALTESGTLLKSGGAAAPTLRVGLIGARAHPTLRPEQPQQSVSNYFVGNDPTQWHRRVPNYAAVRYEQVYPGVDWVIYGNPRHLEYDFVVSPRADAGQIGLSIAGADRISIEADGDLTIKAGGTSWRQLKPVVYQTDRDGVRHPVEARYVLNQTRLAFMVGAYDPGRPLIIDPELIYSTYIGGSNGYGGASAAAIDAAGDLYIVGSTTSADFPLESAIQAGNGESPTPTAFVSKFNPSGTALLYSTYLGGTRSTSAPGDLAAAVAVDATGNAYVTGYTGSIDFPTVNPYQSSNAAVATNGTSAFVAKIDPTGSTLVYSTYLGGPDAGGCALAFSSGWGIAVDGSGSAYVVGQSHSANFPTVNAYQATTYPGVTSASQSGSVATPCGGPISAVVTKLNPAGNTLAYSTYLGPTSSVNEATSVAVDSSGSAYIAGRTGSSNFPTVAAFQPATGSPQTGFVTKLSPTGATLQYSSYLGGTGVDWPAAVAVDAAGEAYVTGSTTSRDFPVMNPLQPQNNSTLPASRGAPNAFITKINASGSGLIFSTYLGGSSSEFGAGIALDGDGNAYVAGNTTSNDFPTVNPLQASNNGYAHSLPNAFVAVVNSTGSALEFSTYLGGSGYCAPDASGCFNGDEAYGIAVDSARNIYVAGGAGSTDFPTVAAFQATKPTNAQYVGFAAKISGALTANAGTTGTAVATQPGPHGGGGGGAIGWDLVGVCAGLVAIRRRRLSPGREQQV